MSTSFGQRVLAFSPFEGRGDELIYDEEEDRYYNSSSSLLNSDVEQGDDSWTFSLSKLGEKRRRPFVGSGIAMGIFGTILTLCSLALVFSNARHWFIAGSPQATICAIGAGCGALVAIFTLLHLHSIYSFSFNEGSSTYVHFTDFLQKLSLLAIIATAASVLKLWVDYPVNNRPNIMLTYIMHPNRVWILGNLATVSLLLVLYMFVGTSIPYRKINRIYSSNIRTFSLLTGISALATGALTLAHILKNPSIYLHDHLMWGNFGFNIFLVLSSLSLVAAVHKANRANALWMLLILANLGGAVTLTVFDYFKGMDLTHMFILTVLTFTSSILLSLVFAHLIVWRYINFYNAPRRHSTKPSNQMYADF